jgi:hypothetical protein
MPQFSNGYVFISYSRRDDVVMRRIVAFLRKQGIKVWVDNEKLTPGTPIWEAEIEKAIKAAPAIVVVLSPDSKDSEWVRREISLADQYRKRVFPILVSGDEEKSISLRLINRQFVDIRENENIGLISLEIALSAYLQELNDKEENSKTSNEKTSGEQIPDRVTLDIETDHTTAFNKDYQRILWATLGWAIAGLVGGYTYSEYDMIASGAIGGAIGGLIGGLVIVFTSQSESTLNQKNLIKVALSWTIAGIVGWAIGWGSLTGAIGAGIGIGIFAIIGIAGSMGPNYIFSNGKFTAMSTLVWAVCGALGWSIAKGMIDGLYMDPAMSWAIGTAIGWGIGGFFMSWQLAKK